MFSSLIRLPTRLGLDAYVFSPIPLQITFYVFCNPPKQLNVTYITLLQALAGGYSVRI